MISLKWDVIIVEFVSYLLYIVNSMLSWIFQSQGGHFLEYYFSFDRRVDFYLDAQKGENIV